MRKSARRHSNPMAVRRHSEKIKNIRRRLHTTFLGKTFSNFLITFMMFCAASKKLFSKFKIPDIHLIFYFGWGTSIDLQGVNVAFAHFLTH